MIVKPLDFIGIGAGKSGTTTLFHYLRHHPQIYLPPEKEIPFFSDDKKLAQGWKNFIQEYFSQAPLEVIWGKITPQYMSNPRIPQRIFANMPNVKLIALLRNPVDRAFSYYRMMVRLSQENRTFENAVADQLQTEALMRTRTLRMNDHTLTETYIVRGEYGRILKNFLHYFPREQLLVLFTDDLERYPQSVLKSTLRFLELEQEFVPPNLGQRYYVGGSQQRLPWLIPVIRHIFPIRWAWHILSLQKRRAIFFWYKTQINVVHELPTIPSPLRCKLVEFYRPDVRELETIIGQQTPWQEFRVSPNQE